MSATDVGDAIELTFTAATGATVTATWIDPTGNVVVDHVAVNEDPAGSGKYPFTFLPTVADMWQAIFIASGTQTAVETYWVRALPIDGPPPLATIGDVAELFGALTSAQEGLVSALLRRASSMIRNAYPGLADRVLAGTVDPDLVAHAAVNMVLRVIRNPGNLRSETVGPFTRTYDTGAAGGLLVLTDAETALLAPKRTNRSTARSIMMRPGLAPYPHGVHGVYERW